MICFKYHDSIIAKILTMQRVEVKLLQSHDSRGCKCTVAVCRLFLGEDVGGAFLSRRVCCL